MKRTAITLLALVLVLSLCACGGNKNKAFIFPKDTVVLNTDISGTTKEEAWTLLETAAAGYTLQLQVDGASVSVSAGDIGLSCSQDAFMVAADAMEAETDADFSQVVNFDEARLKTLLESHLCKEAVDASLSFDEASGKYVLTPHSEGLETNMDALVPAVRDAIVNLVPHCELTGLSNILAPTHLSDTPESLAALELVNTMTGVELSYSFDANGSTSVHEIPAETLRSFVDLGEDGFTPTISQEAVDAYAAELGEEYTVEGKTGSFRTTGGSTIDLSVSYDGRQVDASALSQDIITCMQEGISGTRTASYLKGGVQDMPYGGTYIEVDLSAQKLWFYKNGECLVSTSIVSGKVAEDMCTPTGVYSIYSKSTNTYLTGTGYRSFVYYWMPFHGGYGLHDATWRNSFGGDIYLYDGSHGCVNLPLKAAGTIYDNAPVGTKVILYGGVRSVPPLTQELTGTTSYDVADDTVSFKLNLQPKYSDPELTYTSDNPAVATVGKDGTVQIKGIGTAKIKVTAPKHSYYTEATVTVTIHVHSACEEGRHVMGSPVTVKTPSCLPGLERTTCTKCSYFTEKETAPVQFHTYGDWVTVKEPTCTEDGLKEHTCTGCGVVKETAAIPATGEHTAGEWEVVQPATCTQVGIQHKCCTGCGMEMERQEQDKLPHNFDGGPTCTVCGAANPDYLPPDKKEDGEE